MLRVCFMAAEKYVPIGRRSEERGVASVTGKVSSFSLSLRPTSGSAAYTHTASAISGVLPLISFQYRRTLSPGLQCRQASSTVYDSDDMQEQAPTFVQITMTLTAYNSEAVSSSTGLRADFWICDLKVRPSRCRRYRSKQGPRQTP